MLFSKRLEYNIWFPNPQLFMHYMEYSGTESSLTVTETW
ncbi:Protein of unknown function [Pyronema omphalodes CBS 100304]|uniref:Uncharacterized protein n=1 Tax=Pyronema omphalodes (strain CBS 100304) TaxID=1076935 RepID=U4LVE3_PYROM|nr:Protein of unknown function [Pyronema omphalodes CBS 100304]